MPLTLEKWCIKYRRLKALVDKLQFERKERNTYENQTFTG